MAQLRRSKRLSTERCMLSSSSPGPVPPRVVPQVARDPTTGESKGYGFISYHDFESADAAIESMNNQYLANKAITVQFAFKKDQQGERHGTPAERLLAHEAKKNNALPGAMMGGGPMGGPGGRPPMMGNMGPGGLGSGANGTSMG